MGINDTESYVQETDGLVTGRVTSPKPESKLTLVLLSIQTVVLVLLLGLGAIAYRNLDAKTNSIDNFVGLFENPSVIINDPRLTSALVGLMQNATGDFFFGSATGTIPNFISNIMSTDLGSFGRAVNAWSASVTTAFQNEGQPSSCHQMVQCQPGNQVYCQDGRVRWCDWNTGEVNCAPVSCVAPGVASVFSVVQSVSSKLSKWQPIQSATGDAAFSNGIFQLAPIFDWVKAQTSVNDWQTTAVTCQQFVNQATAINWNGTYTGDSGDVRVWDANHQVKDIANVVNQVCDALANLNAKPQKGPVGKIGKTNMKKSTGNKN